ncbi:hypothetical protein ECZU29_18630 [Escherichia coli]|nr:hypothetical protein ECZU25_26880 [Escherichia coli]GHL47013.1 hypothetical protein ECZU29_18630 [Escherichia coli]
MLVSNYNYVISRRRLLQGAGAMWLLSVSQVSGCGQPCRGGTRLACVQLHPRDGRIKSSAAI